MLIAGLLFAQQPVITFTKLEHDFGRINEADGRVSTVFEFKNEGMEPLVLSNVRASCGCTTPTWTKTPIEPGQTGAITVTYNPNGRPGRFQKTITVTSNATEATKKLYIKGEVIPKAAKPENKYPFKAGELSLNQKSISFGTILKGKTVKKTIEYANLGEEELTVALLRADEDPLETAVTLEKVQKGQSGQMSILFDGAKCKTYGPQEYAVYVMINGKKQIKEEYKITLNVTVDEDFSNLTAEQKQQAPIIECQKAIDLGVITPGKKVKFTLPFNNAGVNPLLVRRIVNLSEDMFHASALKTTVKSGKKSGILIETEGKKGNIDLKPGEYHRTITLITNDPQNPKIQITVGWTVK